MKGYEIVSPDGMYKCPDGTEKWWTEILIDKAYPLVSNRKFPVLIPSYNNPSPPIVNGLLSQMDEDYNYPIFIFVRNSQREDYIKANKHPYVNIISMDDRLIDSAGKAREWSLKWLYKNGYHHAFSFDDDANGLGLTLRGYTGKGDPKSAFMTGIDKIAKVLAVWQLSMERLEQRFNNLMLTGPYSAGFCWKAEYCQMDQSALLYRGNLNQLVCLNVNKIVESGLHYYDNKECGHEDIDLILQGLEKGLLVATIPYIWYSTPPMDIANFNHFGATIEARMKSQQELMIRKWGEFPYVTFRDKRGVAQVIPNFRKYRKDIGMEEYVIDIWNDGGMLEDAARN